MPHRRRLIPQGEDRRQKFERLLVNRMNRALDAIRLIGNLASPNYKHSHRDIQLIRSAFADQINEALRKFEPERPKRNRFQIPQMQEPRIHVVNHHKPNGKHQDQPAA